MRIALATCSRYPDLFDDDRPLADALRARGIGVTAAIWDDPHVPWESFALVAIRNTWDYHERRDTFLAWIERASRVTSIVNPPAVLRWNTHKGYLRELALHGVPTVPTVWCVRGETPDLSAILDANGWDIAVVKPAVSAGARDTVRVTSATRGAARDLLRTILERCDAMIQPYLPSVEGHGERSLLFAGGAFSHSIRKHPLLTAGIDLENQGDGVPSVVAGADEIAFAEGVLAAAHDITGATFTYARVDIAPGPQGLLLMELEVTEPSLFLRADPASADRFAKALVHAANTAERRGA